MCTCSVLGLCQVSVLEYIHENEYVHADIKAANLMLGYRDPEQVSPPLLIILHVHRSEICSILLNVILIIKMVSYQLSILMRIMTLRRQDEFTLFVEFVNFVCVVLCAAGLPSRLWAVLQILSRWSPQRIQGKPQERPQWNHRVHQP